MRPGNLVWTILMLILKPVGKIVFRAAAFVRADNLHRKAPLVSSGAGS